MKKRGIVSRAGRWLVWVLAWAILAWMAWDFVFSEHGYRVYVSEKTELQTLKTELAELKKQRELLAKEILRLRNDPKALEELVRRELGYVYPDEYMLIIPKDKKQPEKGASK